MARTTTSTPASSLDLEWEHEGLPLSMTHDPSASSWYLKSMYTQRSHKHPIFYRAIFPEDNLDTEPCHTESSTQQAHGSNSDWSRVSSADSLEWDNVQNSFHASPPISDVDTDTQLLLSEIERLTTEALKETGHTLIS
ncbi:hypothetical protein ILUMI_22862 [Ignelater luminosus]|uniref:Uncharacterized protein n=1 Tax=Ignelater luminosus TaxID=2038154 RepID=A0A8K0G047_IGNLU|nr:hypothetical protein ILUMI_22862 [Ignelater luminosus]